jgi:hypothetical protein
MSQPAPPPGLNLFVHVTPSVDEKMVCPLVPAEATKRPSP